jgi:two-component system CheB/CheR fusion protein
VPEHLRTKYFEANGTGWTFRGDLRRCVIFGEHDLVQDAPISRIDLLVCRNTLIYFNSDTQGRILARFHFALAPEGFIFLGKSEMLLTHSRLFQVLDVRARIFQRLAKASVRDRLLLAQAENDEGNTAVGQIDLREASFDSGPVAQVVVDKHGTVVLANQQARHYFRIGQRDIGKPIQDLEISYRPIEIRARIEQAYTTRLPVELLDVEYKLPHGEHRYYDILVAPLIENGRESVGVSISYVEVSAHHRLRQELERSTHELEAAYEELQATNAELETTNEELQSTIEELETTNEELQSTNEELETMNEELHSTNEELETINEELRRRTTELNTVNDFMEAILTSMRAGVVVTDQAMHVMLWNAKAEDLWGLRREEVEGKVLTKLDIGLPLDGMAKSLRACLEGTSEFELHYVAATNRRGKSIQCRVSCSRLVTPDNKARGMIVLMEEWNGEAK